ncbi:MAG: hypothetical protein IPG00_09305 [Saprospiraceae bacterium]|nr:hypothetical protein [Saprospiraceae bacterium]
MVKDFYSENLDKEENFESLAHEFILFAFNGEPNNLSNDIADMSACCAKHPFNIELKQI